MDTCPTAVRREFRPYDHGAVKKLLREAALDFGPPGGTRRWSFATAQIYDSDNNAWVLDFSFRDPHDATLFALKYL